MSEKNTLSLKQRMTIARVRMPEIDPIARSRNFEEVNRGLPLADAIVEATRCIECAKPGCVEECPVGVKVKEVVALVYTGDYLAAAAKLGKITRSPQLPDAYAHRNTSVKADASWAAKARHWQSGISRRFVADYERESGVLACRISHRRRENP